MDSTQFIARLETGARVIETLARGVTREQAVWKPAPGKWSLLEVVCHLLDEEREDFRLRVDLLLHHPGRPWPPIDPEGWVTERGYARKDLEETLNAFLAERARSLAWLRGLKSPAWENAFDHPRAGRLAAGDLFSSWVAHDLQHIRQLARLHYEYVAREAAPWSVAYAG